MSTQYPSDVHKDKALTNYAISILDEFPYVADETFPVVEVEDESDEFWKWDTPQASREIDGRREAGTRSAQIDLVGAFEPFKCLEYARSIMLPERTEGNADEALNIRETYTETVQMSVRIEREIRVAALLNTTGNYPTSHVNAAGGLWTTPATDPRPDVDAAQNLVSLATRGRANRLVINKATFDALRVNDAVAEALKYTMATTEGRITPALLAEFFDIEQVIVAEQVYETGVEGAASTPAFIWTAPNAQVLRVEPSPSKNTNHFGSTFSNRVGRVKRWREEGLESDIIEYSSIVTEKIANNNAGALITGVAA